MKTDEHTTDGTTRQTRSEPRQGGGRRSGKAGRARAPGFCRRWLGGLDRRFTVGNRGERKVHAPGSERTTSEDTEVEKQGYLVHKM